jgi:hypothetical protein
MAARTRRHALIGWALVLVAALDAATAARAETPLPGRIAFVRGAHDGRDHIFLASNADQSPVQLTSANADDDRPSWSSDGRLLAFLRDDAAVWAMRADGTDAHRLAAARGDAPPAWSSDSRFVAVLGSGGRISVVSVAGRRVVRRLAVGATGGPVWLQHGILAFPTQDGLTMVPVTGGRPRLVSKRQVTGAPAWSQDGALVAFVSPASGHDRLLVVPTRGGRARVLASVLGTVDMAWSPHGTALAWSDGESLRIATLAGDRTGIRTLRVPTGVTVGSPAWSPDGRWLVYPRQSLIWASRLDGADGRPVVSPFPNAGGGAQPAWGLGAPVTGTTTASVAPPIAAQTELSDAPTSVASDGSRALLFGEVLPDRAGSATWSATSGAPTALGIPAENVDGALAGATAAWRTYGGGNSEQVSDLYVSVGGAPAVKVASGDVTCDPCKGDELSMPRGQGDLLVYTSQHVDGPTVSAQQLWRLDGTTPVLLGPARSVEDVDSQRILVTQLDGTLAVLDSSGMLLSHLAVSPPAGASALVGNQVVVLDAGRLAVYDLAGGLEVASWPAPPASDHATLLGAAAGIAAYLDGIAVHIVRLSDGRDVTLRILDESSMRGDLNASGLFASFDHAAVSGAEAVFVTLDSLVALLAGPSP